jgi:DNA-binding PadR family transcriptional regulator
LGAYVKQLIGWASGLFSRTWVYLDTYILFEINPIMKPHVFQVLLALADQDRHGLAIMRDVLDRTEGRMHLWPGMLYGALKELVEGELAVEKRAPRDGKAGGGKPRYYGITERGRRALAVETERLERYVQAARARNVLKPVGPRG